MLAGRLVWEFYDELERICTDYIELTPNGQVVALNVRLDNGILLKHWKAVPLFWNVRRERMSRKGMKIFWHYRFYFS